MKRLLVFLLALCLLTACAETSKPAATAPTAATAATTETTAEAPTEETVRPLSPGLSYEMKTEELEFPLSDGLLYYKNEITYPEFSGKTSLERSLNQSHTDLIERLRKDDSDYDAQYASMVEDGIAVDAMLPFFDDWSTEVTFNAEGLLSLKRRRTMWSGGMHPYSSYTGEIYDTKTGRRLQLEDLLPGGYTEEVLSYYADAAGVSPDRMREDPFVLTEEGLCFLCWVGDAVPPLEVTIPFTDGVRIDTEMLYGERIRCEGFSAAIRSAMEELAQVPNGFGQGAFYDVDGNGSEELLLLHHAPVELEEGNPSNYLVCSVYALGGKGVVPIMDHYLLYPETGTSNALIGVVRNRGEDFFYLYWATEGGAGRYGELQLHRVINDFMSMHSSAGFNCTLKGGKVDSEHSQASINGVERSYGEFVSWQDQLERQLTISARDGGGESLEELLSHFTS